jgi:hypothetical protein
MDVTKDLVNSCMHNQMISVISTLEQGGIDTTCLSYLGLTLLSISFSRLILFSKQIFHE